MKSQQQRLGFCCRAKIAASVALLSLSVASANADTYTVTNSNDAGGGSLRMAINDNNSSGGGNTIVFGSAFNGPTIVVGSGLGELLITKNVTIVGPGANLLQISGGDSNRIFNVASGVSATISGL